MGERQLKLSFANWKQVTVVGRTPPTGSKISEADFALFWEVWDRVSELYVEKSDLEPKKMIDGAISGMVSSLGDPYTMYLPVQQNKETKEELGGAFEGVGIQLGYKDKQLAVMTPLDGTPAFKAGVKAGDLILKIKDEAKGVDVVTSKITVNQAMKMIRGTKGTEVKLTLFREGIDKPFEVPLIRDTIVVKSVTAEYVPVDKKNPDGQKVAVIKLSRFGDRTQDEWAAAVSDVYANCPIKGPSCRGLVLDLRNNPGGYLELAVYIAGEFLKPGKLVVEQAYGDGSSILNKVDRNGRLVDMPMIVLVNGGSASAAEILSGSIQDHQRARVVGEKSFGKGSVQKPEDFPDGSGIHVTVAKWLRPSGEWLDKKGITPDVIVESEDATDSAQIVEDKQLLKAIELLK